MILQICDTPNYRAYVDRRTGDVIMQADPTDGFMNGYSSHGHWEVIVRGIKTFAEKSETSVCEGFQTEGNGFVHRQRNEQNPDFSDAACSHRVDAKHINHKKGVVAGPERLHRGRG